MSYRIVVFAFLCHRDDISIKSGEAGTIAAPTLEQLKRLKKCDNNEIGVWFVCDNPGMNTGDDRMRFATLDSTGAEVVDTMVVPADHSVTAVMQAFLKWTTDATTGTNAPSLFLYSGHGTPGFGLGRASPGRGELLEIAQRPELQGLLAEFANQIDQIKKETSPADRDVLAGRLQEQLPADDSYELLRSLKGEVFLELFAVLNRVRIHSRYLEVGLNLMSSGTGASSVLSVRAFNRLIQQVRPHKPFDVMLLQACALGLIDVAYELRNTCLSLVAATTLYSGNPTIKSGLLSALKEMSHGMNFANYAPYSIIQSYMYDRFHYPIPPVGFISTVPYADVQDTWKNLNNNCRTLFTILKLELSRGGATAARRLSKIRNALPRCRDTGCCDKTIYDLNEFVSAVAIEFPEILVQRSELVGGIIALHTKLIRYRHATPEAAFSCCANGMALYFPRTKDELFKSYNSGSDDGFDWVSETGWLELLKEYLSH